MSDEILLEQLERAHAKLQELRELGSLSRGVSMGVAGDIHPDYLRERENACRRIQEEFAVMIEGIKRLQPCPGWTDLILSGLEGMRNAAPAVKIAKIANKWGECDVFPDLKTIGHGDYDMVLSLHSAMRNRSRTICAWCGTLKEVTTGPVVGKYVMSLCPTCRAKYWIG